MSRQNDNVSAQGQTALSLEVADELQRRILWGEIPVGAWLRQDAIAKEFGVSRTPVREAFRALHRQGVIQMEPHRGALVHGPSPRDLREIDEVRAELEGYAAELATERITDEQLRRLRDAEALFRTAIERFVAPPETPRRTAKAGEAWIQANELFHAVVLEAAGNRQLTSSVQDLFRRSPRNASYAALSGNSFLLRKNVEEHEAIRAAIEARDPDRARAEMRGHLRRAGEHLARWVEDQSATDER